MTAPEPRADAPSRRRVLCLWLPRLASERRLRQLERSGLVGARGADRPFAIVTDARGGRRLACVDRLAAAAGLRPGMPLADAYAMRPDLATAPAQPAADRAFLERLARWACRYSPFVGLDGPAPDTPKAGPGAEDAPDGLALDIGGSAHLFGGEAALAEDLGRRLERLGLTVRLGLACSRGAAWALARFAARDVAPDAKQSPTPVIAAPGAAAAALGPLPPAALRLDGAALEGLERLGVRRIDALAALPRGALARRFGASTLRRLDQALGFEAEPITPLRPPPTLAARLSLPDPIGLTADLEAALDRLLARLCPRLEAAGLGARRLALDLRRIDRRRLRIDLTLARPSRDAALIAKLYAERLGRIDAGFGIDGVRLEAIEAEELDARQATAVFGAEPSAPADAEGARFAELLSRLGARLGFERLIRLAPGQAHPPDRATQALPAADAPACSDWPAAAAVRPPRPLTVFAPEPVLVERGGVRRGGAEAAAETPAVCTPSFGAGGGSAERAPASTPPPERFSWRGRWWRRLAAEGPERIAPEWWLDDPAWREGVRDYWRVEAQADGAAPEARDGGGRRQRDRQEREAEADTAGSAGQIARLWLFHLPELARMSSRAAARPSAREGEAPAQSSGSAWRVAGVFP